MSRLEDVWTGPRLERWLRDGQRVRAITGTQATYHTGKVVAYCEHPMVLIEDEKGEKVWWRMDMCLPVSDNEQ